MKERCTNQKNFSYTNYGGRGIMVCPRWTEFSLFLADMGIRPGIEYSLERIDNDGQYAKDNCKWATRQEQNANSRHIIPVTINGEIIPLKEACRRLGFKYCTVINRLAIGWSLEEALTVRPTPNGRGHKASSFATS
jgi:hypothetical protein